LRQLLPELSVTGGTSSSFRPPVFGGFYYSNKYDKWIEEQVSVVIIDIPYTGEELTNFIILLETEFSNFYMAVNSAQEDIGVSVSELNYTSY
jgi:hypothetical protein